LQAQRLTPVSYFAEAISGVCEWIRKRQVDKEKEKGICIRARAQFSSTWTYRSPAP